MYLIMLIRGLFADRSLSTGPHALSAPFDDEFLFTA